MERELNTVEEMAAAWRMHPRRIQHLCKQGKIAGAIKSAGTWFIPKDARLLEKDGSSDASRFQFTGTKKKIFDCAIKLFVARGFGEVTIRDITDAVGINQSTMYYHFQSKQEILDIVYDYYCYYYLLDRPSIDDIEPILRKGSLLDIVRSVVYDFDGEYVQYLKDITKLVFQRSAIDGRAKEIIKSLMLEEGKRFVEAVFDRAVEIGRLAPFDTYAMSVFINSTRMFMLQNWIVDDSLENALRVHEEEATIYAHAAKVLTDLRGTTERGVATP